MIAPEILLTFFVASVALGLAPGPDNLFVLTQSILQGQRAGLLVTLGLCTGLIAHSTAVALGVAAVIKASPMAFTALKIIGACYLVYLAWQLVRANRSSLEARPANVLSGLALYQRGIIMNITNPKVLLFFLAFLPQFTDPGAGSVTLQIFILGFVFIIATLLVFGSVALLAGPIGTWLKQAQGSQAVLNWVAAAIFVLLALNLVFN